MIEDKPMCSSRTSYQPLDHLPARRDFTASFFFLNDFLTFTYFVVARSRRSRRQYPPSMVFASAARPFFACFFKPVSKIARLGWNAFSSFLLRALFTIVSFLPVSFRLTSSTFLFANPLYLKEFNPQRLPRSA